MQPRYKTRSAVFILIENKKGQFLFQQRHQTGYLDGSWDASASGHIEEGETALEAAQRELEEELNLWIALENFQFMGVCHRKSEDAVYYDFYFRILISEEMEASISIGEQDKISQIMWFDSSRISGEVIDYVAFMYESFQKGRSYGEWGWNQHI